MVYPRYAQPLPLEVPHHRNEVITQNFIILGSMIHGGQTFFKMLSLFKNFNDLVCNMV